MKSDNPSSRFETGALLVGQTGLFLHKSVPCVISWDIYCTWSIDIADMMIRNGND